MDKFISNLIAPIEARKITEAFDEFTNFLKPFGDNRAIVEYKVTPALAACLLSTFNTENRHISTNSVDKIATDIRHGRFQADNGQTIVLSKELLINDGQHRLAGIVKAGLAVDMAIAINRERDTRFTLDTGTKRTTGHVLGLLGYSYGNTIAAAARRVEAFRHSGNIGSTTRVSDSKVFEVATNDELLKEVAQWAHTYQAPFRGLGLPASEVATAMYLFSEKEGREAKVFFEALRDGLGLSKGTPIHTLRQKLISSPRLTMIVRFELLVRAWNFWIRDETIERFSIMGKVPAILGKKKPVNSKAKATENA